MSGGSLADAQCRTDTPSAAFLTQRQSTQRTACRHRAWQCTRTHTHTHTTHTVSGGSTLRPGSTVNVNSTCRFTHTHTHTRGSVVERRSLAGELSLSCARPAADG